VNLQHDQLQERTTGATFSGPIIRNKLFFFLGWEDFKRVQAAPGQNFVPDAGVIAQIIATAKADGYDAGTNAATTPSRNRRPMSPSSTGISVISSVPRSPTGGPTAPRPTFPISTAAPTLR